MTCGGCGAGLAAGDRFCVECGAPAVVCPACGEPAAAAGAAADEARGIAERLGCRPLLDRADTIQPARPPASAPEQLLQPAAESADSVLLHTERKHA